MAHKSTLRKRMQVGLAALLLIGVGGVASTAAFTSQADITGAATAGTLKVNVEDGASNSVTQLENISAKLFAPEQSESDTVTLVNDGNLPARITLSTGVAASDQGNDKALALADELRVALTIDGAVVKEGPLSTFEHAPIDLAANDNQPGGPDTKEVTVTVTMNDGATIGPEVDELQGAKVNIDLVANATQNL